MLYPLQPEYQVVELGDLVTSHDLDYRKRPDFPAELQPRGRDRAAMQLQVERESKRVVPAKLGANPSVASGAPMVNDDLVVESGNGRSLILGKAYRIGRAEEYRDWLRETAPSLGIEGDISDFERPVLVRRRISDVDAGEVRGRRQRGRSGAAFAHGAGGPGREASVRRGPGAAGALGRRDTFREEPGLRGAVP